MKTLNALLAMVIVAALANSALGNRVCLLSGSYPKPAVQSCQGATTEVAGSERLLSMVVTFFKDIVGRIIPGRWTAATRPADVAPQLGRPTEAVKKKASRMGLRSR